MANIRLNYVSLELHPEDLGSEVRIVKAPSNLWKEHKAPPFPFTRGGTDSPHQKLHWPARWDTLFHISKRVRGLNFAWFISFGFPPRESTTSWWFLGWAATLGGLLSTARVNGTSSLRLLCSSAPSTLPWGHDVSPLLPSDPEGHNWASQGKRTKRAILGPGKGVPVKQSGAAQDFWQEEQLREVWRYNTQRVLKDRHMPGGIL